MEGESAWTVKVAGGDGEALREELLAAGAAVRLTRAEDDGEDDVLEVEVDCEDAREDVRDVLRSVGEGRRPPRSGPGGRIVNAKQRKILVAAGLLLKAGTTAFVRAAQGAKGCHGPYVVLEDVPPATAEELLKHARELEGMAHELASALEAQLEKEDEDAMRFHECFRCSGKPGAPTLCKDCFERRAEHGTKWRGPMPPAMRERIKSRAGRAFAEMRLSRGFAP